MVFKLVRTDTEDPFKIQLPVGNCILIGRGEFLDCDDKRVSRKHAYLNVAADTVSLTSTHQNPCFYTIKRMTGIQVLKKGCTIQLSHGDKFGLLPDSFWYELIYTVALDNADSSVSENNQPTDETITASESYKKVSDGNATDDNELDNTDIHQAVTQECGDTLANTDIHQASTQQCVSPSLDIVKTEVVESPSEVQTKVESPSLIKNETGSPSTLQSHNGSPSIIQKDSLDLENDSASSILSLAPSSDVTAADKSQSPTKRSHCLDSSEEVKKIKTEPQEIKQEPDEDPSGRETPDSNQEVKTIKTQPQDSNQVPDPQPGPSGDQGNALDPSKPDNSANPGMPQPPLNAPMPPNRERCWYGANCYRKNPAHKVQFAHPNDADWGQGEQKACPYGRSCLRRDPRHWRDHIHNLADNRQGQVRPVRQNRPTQKRQKRRQSSEGSSDGEDNANLIVTGKRQRKTIQRQDWSGSDLDDDEDEDPFKTDDEGDEWMPETQAQSTQDIQDD